MEPLETGVAGETFEATSSHGIIVTSWFLLYVMFRLTVVLLQVSGLKMHQLRGNQVTSLKGRGVT